MFCGMGLFLSFFFFFVVVIVQGMVFDIQGKKKKTYNEFLLNTLTLYNYFPMRKKEKLSRFL